MGSAEIISASAIVAGFGVTAIMFRVQRELYVLEVLKVGVAWLAWADYLVLTSVALAVFGSTLPLLVAPMSSRPVMAIAAASCAAALVLLAGYVPAIPAHYRIELGATRSGPREKGEPIERCIVIASYICASIAFGIALIFPAAIAAIAFMTILEF